MTRLEQILRAMRAGFQRASVPALPADTAPDIAMTWLNEATLAGISVPAPRRAR